VKLDQFAADACQRRIVTGPVEATAMGNLLIASPRRRRTRLARRPARRHPQIQRSGPLQAEAGGNMAGRGGEVREAAGWWTEMNGTMLLTNPFPTAFLTLIEFSEEIGLWEIVES
jgi:hypothetical protein